MRRTIVPVAAVLALVLSGFVAEAAAQGVQYGIIRGTVTDPQGLPILNVTVTALSPSMQGARATTTATDGSYALQQLPVGTYELTFETPSFTPVRRTTAVLLGLTVEQNVQLAAAGIVEEVQVVGVAPPPIAAPIVGANYSHDEIESLATRRTLQGVAQLAPAVTENTPNAGQLAINGAFAFDNVFMLNGVDVNDNIFGSPQNLFIEDAIEQTQILTSGIPAEYGRFTGGVVNAVTRSGGNIFSGSFRTNFRNPSWTDETPFETCDPAVTVATCRPAPARIDDVQLSYEGTLGGPIVRDRLWFFGAGRMEKLDTVSTLPISNLPNTQTDDNKRGEIKVTATPVSNHTVQWGYLNNPLTQTSRPSFAAATIDRQGVGDRTVANWYTFGNYRGVLGSDLLVEAQFSQRKLLFNDSGGSSTNIFDSPFRSLNQLTAGGTAHYNAEYFDANDPQNRNNAQVTGNATYFLGTTNAGRHEIKGGYEFFRSQLIGGNSQTPTGFDFRSNYLEDASGSPVFDSNGRFVPVFVPGQSLVLNWRPTRGATLNVDNNSFYAQDHWAINRRWSADLGMRYERVRSEATGGLVGVDTDAIVPRLAVAYDVQGNGRHVVHVTYGHYAGRYNEAQVSTNSNVGNPDLLVGVYNGPPGQGRSFAPGFDPANYVIVQGQFPTANVFFEDNLSSPIVKEFTTSYGVDVMNGRGYAEGSFIWRDTSNLIEDFVALPNGSTTIIRDGVNFGTFSNIVYRNTDQALRSYQAVVFQGRYNLTNRWSVNGHYTVQLKNDGNYEGEAANQPGLTGRIGDYPEAFDAARHFPEGHLMNFQRHKMRAWTVYNHGLGPFGDVSLSGLWRVDSGISYSLTAAGQPMTAIQVARLAAYPDLPENQTVFFGERGSQLFKGFAVLDVGLGYNIPVFRTLRPWIKLDVFNAFNNQKLIAWNRTVNPDPTSPLDSLGLRTGYRQGGSFGKATSTANFPAPFQGLTGGRTFILAAGFRF